MGAVMGSKKLKAIVVRGNQKVELEDPEAFKALAKETNNNVMEPFTTNMFKDLGTSGGVDMYNLTGELPVKFYRKGGGNFDGAYNLSGATMKEKILIKNRHCWGCPIGCGRIVEVKEEGPWQTPVTEGPEYETLAGFGSLMLNENLNSVAKINMVCNDIGVDTISSSSTIALVMDLFEQGKVTADDMDGLEVKFGDPAVVLQLLHKIAIRDGIGDVLANGSDAVGAKFGVDQDQIPTVDHVEAPYHDLRSCFAMAISYGIGPFGASHCAADMYQVLLGQPFPEIGVNVVDKFEINEVLAETTALVHDFRAFTNSLIICNWAVFAESKMGRLIELATGIPMGIPEIKATGKRLIELKRMFNIKMGLDSSWDRIPQILVEPLKEGGTADKSPDWRRLFQLYYAARQWDENGFPKPEMLESLGLQDIVFQ
jgi:aldehyde:ferredoxin oxidoreductase